MEKSYPDLSNDLHALLTAPTEPVRERVATFAVSYARSYLLSRHARWGFGFQEPFPVVAQTVADDEVARLLQMEPGPNGLRLRVLENMFANARRSMGPVPAGTQRAPDDLESLFRMILRKRAAQGAHLAWKKEHPHEARLLRSLKRNASTIAGYRVVRDSRGQFLATDLSNLSGVRIPAEELEWRVRRVQRWNASGILDELHPILMSTAEHGGYCYLIDLVRIACASRLQLVSDAIAADQMRRPDWVCENGMPVDVELRALYATLVERARKLLAKRNGSLDEPVREAWIAVAVDMILRRCGLGSPELAGLPMERALRYRLGPHWTEQHDAMHIEGARDLLRRLRAHRKGRPGGV